MSFVVVDFPGGECVAVWRVLGPLQVRVGDDPLGVAVPKCRAVLAALLTEPARVVSTESLVDELWGADPPSSARKLVAGYVLRLRRQIADPAGRVLITQAPGYRIVAGRSEVDSCCFEDLMVAGREALARGDAARAHDLLAGALGLWRGPALADVPRGRLTTAEADRLEELRLAALELHIEAAVRCERTGPLVAQLRALTARHPLRERFWHQLIRVLEGSGRAAEALAAYARAREVIGDELGAEPGPELQRLYQQLLTGAEPAAERSADAPSAGTGRASPGVVPHQLPAAPRHFTGRHTELSRLTALLPDEAEPALLVAAIDGTPGVGKTALALQWAHQVAHRFGDGQLYVNLRGYDLDQPMSAAEALAGLLIALGVTGQDIPFDPADRAARFRTETAGRRILVVLDNAADPEQVRPLLPGGDSCAVVVTSRNSLAGLVAVDGAHRVDLDLLPHSDALVLLRRLIGSRAEVEPVAVATLADQCARLPLALRIAAELAVARPDSTLYDLVVELTDEQRRLDLLDVGGDPRAAVTTVFSWSLRHLSAAAAHAFRLLGLHPGADFDGYAAAALIGTGHEQACRTLDVLARAHLVHVGAVGRYGMHDLLRAYAAQLVNAPDESEPVQGARIRLFDYYLATAAAAMDRLHPADTHRYPRVPAALTAVPPLPDPASARRWLDTERPNLLAVAAHGEPRHAIGLSRVLFRYLEGGYLADALALHRQARDAARCTGDVAGQAHALTSIGATYRRFGRYPAGAEQLEQAIALFQQVDEPAGQARAIGNLAGVLDRLGRYDLALERHWQAHELFRRTGDHASEARNLTNLATIEERLGRYDDAIIHHEQSLAIHRRIDDHAGAAWALNNLGVLEARLGDSTAGLDHLQQAVALHRQLGNRNGEAQVLDSIATAHLQAGRPDAAIDCYQQALALFRMIGNRDGIPWVLNGLGEAAVASHRTVDALAHYSAALDVATDIGARDQQARACAGLGHAEERLGHADRAREHYRRALALYTELGLPEAEQIRARPVMADTSLSTRQ